MPLNKFQITNEFTRISGKELLSNFGVRIQRGIVAHTADEVLKQLKN